MTLNPRLFFPTLSFSSTVRFEPSIFRLTSLYACCRTGFSIARFRFAAKMTEIDEMKKKKFNSNLNGNCKPFAYLAIFGLTKFGYPLVFAMQMFDFLLQISLLLGQKFYFQILTLCLCFCSEGREMFSICALESLQKR